MTRRPYFICLVLVVLGLSQAAGQAHEKADLPAGALLRIGSVRTPIIHDGEIEAIAFSPDGKWIASAAKSENIHVIRV